MAYFNEEEEWNKEIIEDIEMEKNGSIIVYSRDWTIDTIYRQIKQNNIDLNPKFQRRNAWTDEKRSRLIESLILGLPVPQIVLAEDPKRKKSFLVIDGKQRLLTIAGFIDPENIQYWTKSKLTNLLARKDLNNLSYSELSSDSKCTNEYREFINADLRCTVISNYKNTDILYDIFYRLNSGSVPLSTQELRQVLFKGEFANYLYDITNKLQPLHNVMKLQEPDPKLRDIDILLRFLAIYLYGKEYKGNLKKFLDTFMGKITNDWANYEEKIKNSYESFNNSIEKLNKVFTYERIGRKLTNGQFENRFNKALFEVQVYYFIEIADYLLTSENIQRINKDFSSLCDNRDFRSSIESTTKSLAQFKTRFRLFKDFINDALGTHIEIEPIE